MNQLYKLIKVRLSSLIDWLCSVRTYNPVNKPYVYEAKVWPAMPPLVPSDVACSEKPLSFSKKAVLSFWSGALQLRTPLDELQDVAPELLAKLQNISRTPRAGFTSRCLKEAF
jgi:hypothetical protein